MAHSPFTGGVNCSPLCCVCDPHNESINHVFMDCDWAKAVWFASPLGINFTTNGEETLNFNEWLTKIIIHEARDIVQLVVAICYEIWKVRNKGALKELICLMLSVCNSAIKAIHELNSIDALLLCSVINPIPVPVSAVRWTPPIGNSFKMNVDAAGPNSDGKWGFSSGYPKHRRRRCCSAVLVHIGTARFKCS